MVRRGRRRWSALVLPVLGALAGGVLQVIPASGAVPSGPVTVPLHLVRGSGVGRAGGARPTIEVGVGTNKPVPVVLDTGSLGLHVYRTAISTGRGSGVTLTKRSFSYGFVSGVVLTGVEATATVTIGSLTTSQPIRIGVVTQIGCSAAKPNCPKGTMGQRLGRGIAGIIGVRMTKPSRVGGAVNPLTSLPGVSSWSVHFAGSGGSLVLGGRALVGATVLHLAPAGRSDALAYWSDAPTTCVDIAGARAACVPTLFDTGAPDPVIFGGHLAGVNAGHPGRVRAGLTVSLGAPGQPAFWQFTTGRTSSSNQLLVSGGRGTFNASIAAFYAQVVTFDEAAGTISLASPLGSPLPAPSPLIPFAQPAAAGAGDWVPAGRTVDGSPAVYETSLVPPGGSEPAGLAWMDTHLLSSTLYSGSLSPGGGPYQYTAPVQPAQAATLVAAFNGGFLLKDAQGGYFTEGRTVAPLVAGAASLVIYADGTVDVGAWGTDVTMTPGVVAVRQNITPLVEAGQPTALASGPDWQAWGNTCGAVSCAPSVPAVESQWRSGVGITADGALVYAMGPLLSPSQLAQLLVRAGAVRAMELDINPNWPVLATYAPAPGAPAAPANGSALAPSSVQGPATFFQSSWGRDFVTMSARPPD